MAKLNLTEQQRAVVENRGGNLLVSAAAGSGKTRVLVERLFRYVLEEGRNIDDFLIITYTRAAAAELRSRIAGDLAAQLARSGGYHLQQQLYRIYRADIKTVDAFCAGLIRENVHLLPAHGEESLTADFRVLDEGEADLLRRRTLREVMERFYAAVEAGENPGGRLLADTFGFGRDDSGLEALVLQLSGKLQSHAYPYRWLEGELDRWEHLPQGFDDTLYAPLLLGRLERKLRHWRDCLSGCLEEMAGDGKISAAYGPGFARRVEELGELLDRCARGWDAVAGASLVPIRLGAVRKPEDPALKNRIKAQWDASKKELEKALAALDGTAAEAMEDLAAVAPAMAALLRLAEDFTRSFSREKIRRNAADFSDQEHYAIDLLLGEDGAPTELCQRVGARYTEIMVDEYQDTNEVQNCIFEALAAQRHNLFCVGDVKQSIYRFRLADPTIFLRKYRAFRPAAEAGEGEDRKILLSNNFRSRREILDAANFVFSRIMSQEMGEMDYGAEERLYPGPSEDVSRGGVEFHLLDLPAPEWGVRGLDAHAAEARFVAARIRSLLDEPCLVYDEDQKTMRPCRPGDIAILMRSPSANLQTFGKALQEQGIPCASQETGDFFSAMEVAVTYNLLCIIDNPHQDVPLISVLRSPVFGFSPDRLAHIRGGCLKGTFCDALERAGEQGEEDVSNFLALLARLREAARDLPVHQLLWQLYDQLHLPAVFGAMPGGALRRENLTALYENACAFESAGYRGLFAYVKHLRDMMENGQQPPVAARGAGEGVQIMSIHRSKGLEFPIVILADLNRNFNRQDQRAPVLVHPAYGLGPKRVDLERRISYPTAARAAIEGALSREMLSEEMRVLYVAMTRPKERLILVTTMRSAPTRLSRLTASALSPVAPNAVEGASSLGDWILLALLSRPEARPLWALAEAEPAAAPALDETPWTVMVHSGEDFAPGSRVGRLAAVEEARERPALSFDIDLLDFIYPHEAAETLPTKVTATQLKGRERDQEIAEGTARPAAPAGAFPRPGFISREGKQLTAAERGTALHAVMQHLDLQCADVPAAVERMAAEGRLTPEQAAAVDCAAVERFLQSPLAEEMRRSEGLRREFCFSLLVPADSVLDPAAAGEEILLQGVVDCFFETPAGLVVVDFKTDRVSGGALRQRTEAYRPQVAAYAGALERIFGRPVCRQVLYYFYTGDTVEL